MFLERYHVGASFWMLFFNFLGPTVILKQVSVPDQEYFLARILSSEPHYKV